MTVENSPVPPGPAAKDQAGNQTPDPEPPKDKAVRPAVLATALVVVLVLVIGNVWEQTNDSLQVVASFYGYFPDKWGIRGRILDNGDPVHGAVVWAVAADSKGNRYSPASTKSDDGGSFEIRSVNPNPLEDPPTKDPATLQQILVRARAATTVLFIPKRLNGDVLLTPNSATRLIEPITMLWGLGVLMCLGLSLALAAMHKVPVMWRYYLTLLMTLSGVFMIALVFTRAHGELTSELNTDTVVRTLGFVNIFKGRYVDRVQPEWLVSLTSPPSESPSNATPAHETTPSTTANGPPSNAATPSNVTPANTTPSGEKTPGALPSSETARNETPETISGFGAPLWTLVLSIAGAALFTVALVVKEIRSPPTLETAPKRMQGFVEHQLFMVFAPFGGIFVYQTLVLADAAGQPITVGLAALGSGITLNLLLARASRAARESLGDDNKGTTTPGKGAGGEGHP